MILAEELRNKYALTSFKGKNSMVLLAINEAIDAAAKIADQEHSPIAAGRIRSLKWADSTMAFECTYGTYATPQERVLKPSIPGLP